MSVEYKHIKITNNRRTPAVIPGRVRYVVPPATTTEPIHVNCVNLEALRQMAGVVVMFCPPVGGAAAPQPESSENVSTREDPVQPIPVVVPTGIPAEVSVQSEADAGEPLPGEPPPVVTAPRQPAKKPQAARKSNNRRKSKV